MYGKSIGVMMKNLVQFTVISLVVIVATLLVLAVSGVLDATELRTNLALVAKLVAIVFGASAVILLVSKSNK